MKIQRPRGTQDLLPADADRWRRVTDALQRCLVAYGYGEIRTPLFESAELFVRGVGTGTDIVQKEMYTFEDRGGRSLALRPEGTAAVVRAWLENHLGRDGGVQRLWYLGPMYRGETPQAGRFREFFQVGVEAIGSPLPELDVEVVDVLMAMLHEVGLGGLVVQINSVGHPGCRQTYEVELGAALEREAAALCGMCRERARTNPLRVFDCKNPSCRAVAARLPLLRDHLCEGCRAHHAAVREGLDALGVTYHENPRLVRGLDYYTRTAFEVHAPALGAQSALGGGGRYDGLVEVVGGPPTPAVGFAAGIERILAALAGAPAGALAAAVPVLVLPVGQAARRRALGLARELRRVAPAQVDLTGHSLKAMMRGANRVGARVAVILGDDEMARGEVVVRDLADGQQVAAAEGRAAEAVRRILHPAGGGT